MTTVAPPALSRDLRQNAILEAVVFAAESFLKNSDRESNIPPVLARLGSAAAASRAYVFENRVDDDGVLRTSQSHEWVERGISAQLGNAGLQNLSLVEAGLGRWEDTLGAGEILHGVVAKLPRNERTLLVAQEILSLAIVPIVIDSGWWGFIGFDDCEEERSWSVAELSALRAAADMFGAMIERHQAELDLRESQRVLATLMSNLPGMAYHCRLDEDWTMVFVSEGAFELTGYAPECLVDNRTISYASLIHSDDRDEVMHVVEAAVRARAPFRMVYRIQPASGPGKWVWEQGRGVFSSSGELQWLEGFITDVTEARQAEENARRLLMEQNARAAAQASEQRSEMLAEASRILGTTFDYPTTLAGLASLAVPATADYCTVDMVDREGDVVRMGAVHVDPAKEAWLREVTHATSDGNGDPVDAALSHGRSTLDGESLITVPLVVPDGNVGAITLGMSDSGRRYTTDDLELAEELARRAAMAVEHARLFQNAQQATRARDHILAIVAHDLRNPLNTALMATELLLELPHEEGQEKHLEMIRRSATGMDRLIQDLLDVTRIESGRLLIEARSEDVQPLVDEAMAMLRPLAVARSIHVGSEVEPGLPSILVDAPRILQVFSNLLGNATKFTPPNGRIGIRCESVGDEVRFAVTDTGPGIPQEQIPHIFGGFWQGQPTDRRGIGLGLSIAQGIVEAHGGRIWVECDETRGSTFYFTVPASQPPEARA